MWRMINKHGYHIMAALKVESCFHVTAGIHDKYINSICLEDKLYHLGRKNLFTILTKEMETKHMKILLKSDVSFIN